MEDGLSCQRMMHVEVERKGEVGGISGDEVFNASSENKNDTCEVR